MSRAPIDGLPRTPVTVPETGRDTKSNLIGSCVCVNVEGIRRIGSPLVIIVDTPSQGGPFDFLLVA